MEKKKNRKKKKAAAPRRRAGDGCLRCAASPARCPPSPFSSLSSLVFLPFFPLPPAAPPAQPDGCGKHRPRMPKVINASRARPRLAPPGAPRPGSGGVPRLRELRPPPARRSGATPGRALRGGEARPGAGCGAVSPAQRGAEGVRGPGAEPEAVAAPGAAFRS